MQLVLTTTHGGIAPFSLIAFTIAHRGTSVVCSSRINSEESVSSSLEIML